MINVKADFFTSITADKPVTLTFHFWSGTKVTYVVTKSDTTVIGTAG